VRVFDSTGKAQSASGDGRRVHPRRLRATDFDDVPTLDHAIVFVCGPDRFMADVRAWLEPRIDPGRLRFESFDF